MLVNVIYLMNYYVCVWKFPTCKAADSDIWSTEKCLIYEMMTAARPNAFLQMYLL